MKDHGNFVIDIYKAKFNRKTIISNVEKLGLDYIPKNLPHREKEMSRLAEETGGNIGIDRTPSNFFILGKPGTGKTALTKFVLNVSENYYPNFKMIYINCKVRSTHYAILREICTGLGVDTPVTGFSTAELLRLAIEKLNEQLKSKHYKRKYYTIVLDEIDNWRLSKNSSNDLLYQLSRINEFLDSHSRVSLIGITNDVTYRDGIDARVISSLRERELILQPYNSPELEDILFERAKEALYKDSYEKESIKRIAAICASEHGDARKAVELLFIASKIAEEEEFDKVNRIAVDKALIEIESRAMTTVITGLPIQSKILFASILVLDVDPELESRTPIIYERYREICGKLGFDSLSERRISDLLNELDVLGILSARIVSRGRKGRTKMVKINCNRNQAKLALIRSYKHFKEFLKE